MSDREKKDPGQLAYEAYNSGRQWGGLWTVEREAWAAVEAAIYDDAAKCAEEKTKAPGQRNAKDIWRESVGFECAAAIRAKIGGSHG